jgi:hypothetical protein
MMTETETVKTAANILYQGSMRLEMTNRNSLKNKELEESKLPAILEKEVKRPSSSRV